MTKIRRINSYKNPYLPISKLSHMNAYGADPVDAVHKVDPVPPMENELTQVNKYMDIKDERESPKNKSTGDTQTVSELTRNQGSVHPKKNFETVTMNLGRYEQMRKDVERLKQLEEDLSRMIQYFPDPTSIEGAEGYRIQIKRDAVKEFTNKQISSADLHSDREIDITEIKLI
jgi:hypothetical protein